MEIDAKAKKCPHCQADQRGWFARHPILTTIMVIILIGIVGSAAGGNKNSSNNTGTKGTSQASDEPSITPAPQLITTQALADDFDANKVAAEAKWKDKFVQFSAKISNITDSGLSFTGVASKQFSMTQISCRVDDKNQLMSLKNGQTVTVHGIVGTQTIGVIDIRQCEVVK